MQLHSTAISEPAAQAAGFVAGVLAYAIVGLLTPDHNTRLWAGLLTSIASNLLVGAPINLALLDLLALFVVRPLSAGAGAAGLALLLNAFAG